MTRGIDDAVSACVEFLLGRQLESGCWTDWDLPPGRSSPWTTAYVTVRLAELPTHAAAPALPALHSAARWLLEHELEGGGWGYNDRVGRDGDSTAHAILALVSQGLSVADTTYDRLLEFQRPCGGFSTYAADAGLGSWGEPHPDVSPVAALALLTRDAPADSAVESAVAYVLSGRTALGLWNSFWWSSPLYATRASLSLLRQVGASVDAAQTGGTLSRLEPSNAFECALLLESLHLVGGGSDDHVGDRLANRLVDEQLGDGSWASAPVLRVTSRDCGAPWEYANAGTLYADTDRRFTSATVVAALARRGGQGSAGRIPEDVGELAKRCSDRGAKVGPTDN